MQRFSRLATGITAVWLATALAGGSMAHALVCGDGIPDLGEICDDGNLTSGDGCDANCTPTACGNAVATIGEQCDDGNFADGDGCSALCQRELFNPLPAAGDQFGAAVASVAGDALIGAPLHDAPSALNTGAAYRIDTDTGAFTIFANPTPNAGDFFGASITSVGPNVLIGAPFDDTAGPDAGAAYLVNGATGALIRTFVNPAPGVNDRFGTAVASVAGDVLIGAPLDTHGFGGGGAVYRYNTATGHLIEVFFSPNPVEGEEFGAAIASRGNDVIVGAPGHDVPEMGFIPPAPNAGAAYLFDGTSGALLTTMIHGSPDIEGRCGAAVTASGNDIVVGCPGDDLGASDAGAAYLFSGTTGTLIRAFRKPAPDAADALGVALAAVGTNRLLVSAPSDDTGALNAGAAYLFDVGTGGLIQSFQKPTPVSDDRFGEAVAWLGGALMAIGAPLDDTTQPDAGAVYVVRDASCGNGTLNFTEVCDDGNLVNGDGCDGNCTPTGCGNGIVTAGEACDDGNTLGADGCSATCQSEGICGDMAVGPGEICDDGNTTSGDGCDANCRPTGCGNGIVTVGEQCDNGAANGTDSCCSATCIAVDDDGDGVCDSNDVCPTLANPSQANQDGDIFGDACDMCPEDTDNDSDLDGFCLGNAFQPPADGGNDPCSRGPGAPPWIKPSALFGRLDLPPGDEKFRIKGQFTMGSMVPFLAPERNGMHIRVVDKNAKVILDETLPGIEFNGVIGWRAIGIPARKWRYIDKSKPPLHNGIRKVVIKDLSRFEPGRIGIVMGGKPGLYPLIPGDEPLTMSIEMNDASVPPGSTPGRDQCAEITFGVPPAKPACEHKAAAVKCK